MSMIIAESQTRWECRPSVDSSCGLLCGVLSQPNAHFCTTYDRATGERVNDSAHADVSRHRLTVCCVVLLTGDLILSLYSDVDIPPNVEILVRLSSFLCFLVVSTIGFRWTTARRASGTATR